MSFFGDLARGALDVGTFAALQGVMPGAGASFLINRYSGQGYDFGGALAHTGNDMFRSAWTGGYLSPAAFAASDAFFGEGLFGLHDGSNTWGNWGAGAYMNNCWDGGWNGGWNNSWPCYPQIDYGCCCMSAYAWGCW